MRYDLLHPKALRKAVIEHLGTDQNVPQERQFRRWVSGDTPVPGWARRIIDEVMGMPAQQETPRPEWAEGLAEQLAKLQEQVSTIPDRAYADQVGGDAAKQVIAAVEGMLLGDATRPDSLVGRFAARLEDQLRQSGLLGDGETDEESTEPPGNAGTKPQRSV